jgi:hypothetical protein
MARPSGRGREQRVARQVEERQVEETRRSRAKGFIVGGIVVGVVAVLAALIAFSPPPPGVEFPDLGNDHLSAVTDPHPPYNSSPPSSGPHFGGLAPWGESQEPVPPELFIHNLEDAGIVLTYDCPEACDDLVDGLREILTDLAGRTIVLTPYTGIVNPTDGKAYRAAAVAWTRVLYFDELTDDMRGEVEAFIGLYEGIDHHLRTSN